MNSAASVAAAVGFRDYRQLWLPASAALRAVLRIFPHFCTSMKADLNAMSRQSAESGAAGYVVVLPRVT